MNFFINDFLGRPGKKQPFDVKKDAVVYCRGSNSREKYFFNLNHVNVFYLNNLPRLNSKSVSYYFRKYPSLAKNSIFSFIHGNHFSQLINKNIERSFHVISWRKKDLDSRLVVTNVMPTCLEFLGLMLKNRNIYIIGSDFDMDDKNGKERNWISERDGVKAAIIKYGVPLHRERLNGKNKYIFITPNRYFHSYMSPELCNQYFNILEEKEILSVVEVRKAA